MTATSTLPWSGDPAHWLHHPATTNAWNVLPAPPSGQCTSQRPATTNAWNVPSVPPSGQRTS